MAATRKLQAEIDRCLKKVAEGTEKFDETWQKVHNASNSNQKEKYEEDLKKEIKKLQRLRDQIKTWIASAEIKDKSVLMEKRKLIELKMEKFKVVERETKTKAYSKEGLTSGTKMDPAEKERAETGQWLNSCIDSLNLQIDQFEAEIESLGTSTKKKKTRSDNSDKIEDYQSMCEKHRDHVQKLETLLRMLDNGTVDIVQIKDIKEDVEYYIENCQEPDFTENEMMYDDIEGLEEMLLDLSNIGCQEHNANSVDASETMSTNSASSPIPYMQHNHSLSDQNEVEKRRHKSSSEESKGVPQIVPARIQQLSAAAVVAAAHQYGGGGGSSRTTANNNGVSSSMSNGNNDSATVTNSSAATAAATSLSSCTSAKSSSSSSAAISSSSTIVKSSYGFTSTPNNSSPSSGTTATTTTTEGLSNHVGLGCNVTANTNSAIVGCLQQPNFAAAVSSQQVNGHASSLMEARSNSSPPAAPASSSASAAAVAAVPPPPPPSASITTSSSVQFSMPSSSAAAASILPPSSNANDDDDDDDAMLLPTLRAMAKSAVDGLSVAEMSSPSEQQQRGSPTQLPVGANSSSSSSISQSGLFSAPQAKDRSQKKTEAHIPPLLGVAPLGPVPLNKETQLQYAMLEAAFMHMPHPSDSERLRPYLPRNPCVTPSYYPQLPPVGSDSIDFFLRLTTETLFFIFYYMEGTKAQYLAAKALKKQSWRFHTKYMMWFQRHEEPKIINDEFEQGTYIYFDFEKWGQRKKDCFTFEYRFLEDRDLS